MQIILAIMFFLLGKYGIEWLYWTLFYMNMDSLNSESINWILSLMVHHNYISAAIVMIPIVIFVTVMSYRAGVYD